MHCLIFSRPVATVAAGLALAFAAMATLAHAQRGTEPMSPAQRFSMPETREDGPWNSPFVNLEDSPLAEQVLRIGDIDNFGFGWQVAGNPFYGRALRERPVYWLHASIREDSDVSIEDPPGTDLIFVGDGQPEKMLTLPAVEPEDHYLSPAAIDARYLPFVLEPKLILIQIYGAGFEAAPKGSQFQATLNGQPFPELTELLNLVEIPDGGGRLISAVAPPEFLDAFAEGQFELRIVDRAATPGDAYMVDFLRLLIDPKPRSGETKLRGQILGGQGPIKLRLQGQEAVTNDQGEFTLNRLQYGFSLLEYGENYQHQALVSLQNQVANRRRLFSLSQ